MDNGKGKSERKENNSWSYIEQTGQAFSPFLASCNSTRGRWKKPREHRGSSSFHLAPFSSWTSPDGEDQESIVEAFDREAEGARRSCRFVRCAFNCAVSSRRTARLPGTVLVLRQSRVEYTDRFVAYARMRKRVSSFCSNRRRCLSAYRAGNDVQDLEEPWTFEQRRVSRAREIARELRGRE